jgi:hypothetical protein
MFSRALGYPSFDLFRPFSLKFWFVKVGFVSLSVSGAVADAFKVSGIVAGFLSPFVSLFESWFEFISIECACLASNN